MSLEVWIVDNSMFAREEDDDQRFEISVRQGHVRRAEGRHDLDAPGLKVITSVDDHGRKPLEARLAQCSDLEVVSGEECGDSEPVPRIEPAMKPSRVGPDEPFVECTASDNEEYIVRDRHSPHSGYALGHKQTLPTHSDSKVG